VIRLAVRVHGAHAETVLAELLELAPAGVEEVAGADDTVEYAVYGAPGELPELPALRALAGEALVAVSTAEIPDDWHERWKQFHRPVRIQAPRVQANTGARIPSLRVRPPWEPADAEAHTGTREIVIDPAQAFGTGAHATTHLCLELLLALAVHERPSGALLDVGSGSGVLAIAAHMVGYEPVLALDYDPESVRASRENAAVNGARIDVRRFDLRAQRLPWPTGRPVVLANLLRPLLLELAATLPHTPAHLIAGGLLSGEADELAAAFARGAGLHERERRARGEWVALWLTAG
jgi:ribosomal protein L11 methyltransferase